MLYPHGQQRHGAEAAPDVGELRRAAELGPPQVAADDLVDAHVQQRARAQRRGAVGEDPAEEALARAGPGREQRQGRRDGEDRRGRLEQRAVAAQDRAQRERAEEFVDDDGQADDGAGPRAARRAEVELVGPQSEDARVRDALLGR